MAKSMRAICLYMATRTEDIVKSFELLTKFLDCYVSYEEKVKREESWAGIYTVYQNIIFQDMITVLELDWSQAARQLHAMLNCVSYLTVEEANDYLELLGNYFQRISDSCGNSSYSLSASRNFYLKRICTNTVYDSQRRLGVYQNYPTSRYLY